jgi:hypothetical protein
MLKMTYAQVAMPPVAWLLEAHWAACAWFFG